jgi:poly-gamma-glutamate synthesis protein (capsule biosynthesis protein)
LAPLGCKRAAVELWLGGDVHLGEQTTARLDAVAPLVAGAAGIVNLEGPVGEPPPPAGSTLRLSNSSGALPGLRAAGVRVVGIANNHAADRGPEGPGDTVRSLADRGLLAAGGPAGVAALEVQGRRVVVSAHDLSKGAPTTLASELESARSQGDLLVATFHVTGPPSYLPRPELRTAVEVAVRAGARVIAAHGSHALGPVERRGASVIAWGLGNLLFSCDCTDDRDGAILRVHSDDERLQATIVPIDAGLKGEPARPARDPELILDLLVALGSSPLERRSGSALF